MLALDASYRLEPATRAAIHARSRGPITRNVFARDLIPGATVRAERGGFHCEALFGPLATPRADAIAHLDLPEPVPHPLVPGATLATLAILPAAYRPFHTSDAGLALHDVTYLYALLYENHQMWKRLTELGAPPEMVREHRDRCISDIAALFDNHFAPQPFVYTDGRRPSSLAQLLATRDLPQLEAVLFALGLVLAG